jgi:hypothetical protein
MLIIGSILIVLIGPGEQLLHGFECLAAVWSVISEDYLSSRYKSFGK